MTLDRDKLRGVLSALEAGGSGAAAVYGAYLDRLPTLFGSEKLGGEADLILAALAAAEQAYASAVEAVAPVAFELAGEDADGAPLFRPSAFASVGGLAGDWLGAPLYALACALDRARERQSADDEVYSAAFVYVLFRLKAALGVWRGDASPDARYRLWLKDLAPVIAAHPRLGPKVVACHGRIARAVFEACETYRPALQGEHPPEPPRVFAAFAVAALFHAEASGSGNGDALAQLYATLGSAGIQAASQGRNGRAVALLSAQLTLLSSGDAPWTAIACNNLAIGYTRRGSAKQDAEGHGPGIAIADYDRAISIMDTLRRALESRDAWNPSLREGFASAYTNRGNAKQSAEDHGPEAAVADYDRAIAIREGLRRTLDPRGAWDPPLRSSLAGAYMNKGNAKTLAGRLGSETAIADYNHAIAIMDALRRTLEPRDAWEPRLRHKFALALMNRGVAKQFAEGHGPGAAIVDYDQAISIMDALRRTLESRDAWDLSLREGLASAYTNRGNAKQSAEDHGPEAAVADYDRAIAIREGLRRTLDPRGAWDPPLRSTLAGTYAAKGNARRFADGRGREHAIADYDRAIEIMDGLRRTLEPRDAWDPPLRSGLADTYVNRGVAKQFAEGHGPGAAIADYDQAIEIMDALRRTLELRDAWDPPFREAFIKAHFGRGQAKTENGDRDGACHDARIARRIADDLVARYSPADPPQWRQVAALAASFEEQVCASAPDAQCRHP